MLSEAREGDLDRDAMTPAEWKAFYRDERDRLDLHAMLERAPRVKVPVIFPHTRAEVTGTFVAAAAKAVAESGADEVLALGVLHGAPSPARRVHHPSDEVTKNEFSLDAFEALLAIANHKVRVHARYPLHVGTNPSDLEGIEQVARLAERMPVVATCDPIHHGEGYGDPPEKTCDASQAIDAQLRALFAHDYVAFHDECARVRSDFRNAGPVLAHVLGRVAFEVVALERVDYTQIFGAKCWVAGALVQLDQLAG
ncbi:MAG TPA: hypothetical protein VH054_00330 [Polyangiaceae bacterium]|nr:hypothetical protein [Polyangiaceae bacterium]